MILKLFVWCKYADCFINDAVIDASFSNIDYEAADCLRMKLTKA